MTTTIDTLEKQGWIYVGCELNGQTGYIKEAISLDTRYVKNIMITDISVLLNQGEDDARVTEVKGIPAHAVFYLPSKDAPVMLNRPTRQIILDSWIQYTMNPRRWA
ncbi:hypothetical protein EPN87_04305 [archaeon]|nr:MAG: hypothetical protein EPN87_04305 [archaeon]